MNFINSVCRALNLEISHVLELPRAATGIFLALTNFGSNGKILIPANICYSPIRTSEEAGYTPVFYDASGFSYDCEEVVKLANSDPDIHAILLPSLYGYTPSNLDALNLLDKRRKWLIIEDLAQTFGPGLGLNQQDNVTQVTIYSFGKTKIFEEIRAGLLVCKNYEFLEGVKIIYKNLPILNENEEKCLATKLNQLKNNVRISKNWFDYYEQMQLVDSRLFVRKQLYPINLSLPLKFIENRKRIIRTNTTTFVNRLSSVGVSIRIPHEDIWSSSNLVWRLTIRIEESLRQIALNQIRGLGLPVSAWYDVVPYYLGMLNINGHQNSFSFANQVLNFWVDENHGDEYQIKIIRVLSELSDPND